VDHEHLSLIVIPPKKKPKLLLIPASVFGMYICHGKLLIAYLNTLRVNESAIFLKTDTKIYLSVISA